MSWNLTKAGIWNILVCLHLLMYVLNGSVHVSLNATVVIMTSHPTSHKNNEHGLFVHVRVHVDSYQPKRESAHCFFPFLKTARD